MCGVCMCEVKQYNVVHTLKQVLKSAESHLSQAILLKGPTTERASMRRSRLCKHTWAQTHQQGQ